MVWCGVVRREMNKAFEVLGTAADVRSYLT